MLETSATNVIAAAIGRALGGPGEVTVTGGGFRIRPNKAAAACCIGTTGRVFLAVFDGWGTAFERRRMAVQILVDLDWSVDDMVLSALKQVELTLGHQKRQLVRAAAAGIPSPLDLEAFTDPRRLRIDIAAAVALRQHLGSDPAARAWIKDQLRLASGQVALAGRRLRRCGPRHDGYASGRAGDRDRIDLAQRCRRARDRSSRGRRRVDYDRSGRPSRTARVALHDRTSARRRGRGLRLISARVCSVDWPSWRHAVSDAS